MINLINFHTFKKNKKYVIESECSISGQGLDNCYMVILSGNGYNKYLINLESVEPIADQFGEEEISDCENNKSVKIINKILILDERFLTKWQIRFKPEEDERFSDDDVFEHDSLSLRGYGTFNEKNYFRVDSGDWDDFDHLEIKGIKYQVTDVNVINDRNEPPIYVGSEYKLIKINEIKYKMIEIITKKKKKKNH